MFRQLAITDLIKAVKTTLESGTTLPAYDIPPDNEPAPLVYIELVGLENADTKTMYVKSYTIWIHIIAEEKKSHVPIYSYIQQVQEAMTAGIDIGDAFKVVRAHDAGVNTIKTDPSGEKHAVLEYNYKIAYGMKFK